jgi:hypothetical protein
MKERTRHMTGKRTPPNRVKKPKTLEHEYLGFFTPAPSPIWRNDSENFSLEQPSILKWFPSETTYGVGTLAVPVPANA